jgi:alpha-amylase/alpha-mannosidase (GH57 family)
VGKTPWDERLSRHARNSKGFPAVRQNFNLVPSLLEQRNDYMENNARDSFLEATRKRPQTWSEEKLFILENFFLQTGKT